MAVPVKVELFHDGQWNDYTSRVRAQNGIRILYGKSPIGRGLRPAECRLSFNNHDGLFSPRNPRSALYGKIGRDTKLRVSVGDEVRFVGAIPEWPVRSQGAGKDVWSPVVAYGPTYRLGQGGSRSEQRSAYAYYIGQQPNVDAWWPMEEGPLGEGLSPRVGAAKLRISRQGALIEGRAGSLAPWLGRNAVQLPNFVVMQGGVDGSSSTEWTVDILYRIHGPRGDGLIITLRTLFELGTTNFLELRLWGGNVSSPNIAQLTYPSLGTSLGTASISGDEFRGDVLHHLRLHVEQDGSNIEATGYVDGRQVIQESFAGTLATCKRAGIWVLEEASGTETYSLSTPVSVGHLVAYGANAPSVFEAVQAANGWPSERAHSRIARLAGEVGLSATVGLPDSARMGPQPYGSPLDVMLDAAETDDGYLLDDRDDYALLYIAHEELLNPSSTATLDYSQRQVLELELAEPRDVANVVTVHRRDGGEATVERTRGALGTSTIGKMPQQVILTLYQDKKALQHAGWRSHVRSWNEPWIERLTVDLTKLQRDGAGSLADAVASVMPGDQIRVNNQPEWAGPARIEMLVDGYEEFIESHRWVISFHGGPARPYQVGELDGNRLGIVGLRLWEDLDETETNIDLNISGLRVGLSQTAVPFDILIDNERMTVVSVAAPTPPTQNIDVIRGVEGPAGVHFAPAPVFIYRPIRLKRTM